MKNTTLKGNETENIIKMYMSSTIHITFEYLNGACSRVLFASPMPQHGYYGRRNTRPISVNASFYRNFPKVLHLPLPWLIRFVPHNALLRAIMSADQVDIYLDLLINYCRRIQPIHRLEIGKGFFNFNWLLSPLARKSIQYFSIHLLIDMELPYGF